MPLTSSDSFHSSVHHLGYTSCLAGTGRLKVPERVAFLGDALEEEELWRVFALGFFKYVQQLTSIININTENKSQ